MAYLKVICLFVTWSVCRATLLEQVLEQRAERGATACARGCACRGLLWRGYMLARYSCVEHCEPNGVVVQRGVANCSYEYSSANSNMEVCHRHVLMLYKHPLYPEVDLALLKLNSLHTSEMLSNQTSSDDFFLKVDIWISTIVYTDSIQRENTFTEYDRVRNIQMYSTPVRMFLFTVVLPSISFIVFFVYIIFFTGTTKINIKIPSDTIPYDSLNNGRKRHCV